MEYELAEEEKEKKGSSMASKAMTHEEELEEYVWLIIVYPSRLTSKIGIGGTLSRIARIILCCWLPNISYMQMGYTIAKVEGDKNGRSKNNKDQS